MTNHGNWTTVDGSTSRFILLSAALLSVTVCVIQGTIDAAAYTTVIGLVVGAAVQAGGVKQGSEATSAPPPPE